MGIWWRSAVVFAAFVLLVGRRSEADTVLLNPSKDNTLYQDDFGQLSNGQGQHFFAGRTGGLTPPIRRGLISFDIAGNIPAGSTIQNVVLTLHMSRSMTGSEIEIDLRQVLTGWGEGASVAQGEEGMGAPAAPGDATWLHTFHDTDFWSQPGGEFADAVSATAAVSEVGFYSFDSEFNPGLVADVQQWLDQPDTNHGWGVLAADEFLPRSAKQFDTRENIDPTFQPTLTVDYTTSCHQTNWDGYIKGRGEQ
jgi:hypothetical protein